MCWDVAKQVLLDSNSPAEVQLFAAQTLKNRARLCRTAPLQQCQALQHDVLGVLAQRSDALPQLMKQLCLALVDLSLPAGDTLPGLISHVTGALPATTALLTLEYMAEEVGLMTHFGLGGSNEERVEALMELKARLRGCAGGVFSWLSHQAKQPGPPGHAARVLACFNAWTRLGSLQALQNQDDLQALVGLALTHLRTPESEAFEASADALSEVIDHCPEAWLSALQVCVFVCGRFRSPSGAIDDVFDP
ncbi:hypothetical protein FOA52_002565 [Chlamydomonas sp. UWO 241]|nr:hypothetical protein FOA52_002565 [Chlamydomonas sp. UWO 241]